MTYQVTIVPSALRQLAALPTSDQKRIKRKIDSLAANPRPLEAKKLEAQHDLFRLRSGNYRIIYAVEHERAVVLVVKIGHRREVYRRL